MSVVDQFLFDPSVDRLEQLTKEQLIELAWMYDIELSAADKRCSYGEVASFPS